MAMARTAVGGPWGRGAVDFVVGVEFTGRGGGGAGGGVGGGGEGAP